MPIYEFVCAECDNRFEKIQSFSNLIAPVCPNCNGSHVERQMSRPAIHFKGSGWYITDSKKNDKQSANGTSDVDVTTKEKGTDGETAEKSSDSSTEPSGDSQSKKPAAEKNTSSSNSKTASAKS